MDQQVLESLLASIEKREAVALVTVTEGDGVLRHVGDCLAGAGGCPPWTTCAG